MVNFANEEAKAELEVVLASAAFVRSQRMASLLRYLCTKYFTGQSDQVKEYNIAVEVFGRPETFDPSDDAITRVEVHRLRKKLREYYEGEGVANRLRIVIPTGSYIPAFLPASNVSTDAAQPPVVEPARTEPGPPAPAAAWGGHGQLKTNWPIAMLVGIIIVLLLFEVEFHFRPRALAATAGSLTGPVRPVDRDPDPIPDPPLNATPGRLVRFLCGQTKPFVDRLGGKWEGDQFFTGGVAVDRETPHLARAADPDIFQHGRAGTFSYDIPLLPGTYNLHLYFEETEFGPGNPKGGADSSRVFHVSSNGRRILSDFDILSDAGGPNIADERVIKDITPGTDGRLHLRFISHISEAVVSAIELVPAQPQRMNPVRIVVQDHIVHDSTGRTWLPDRYWNGGQMAPRGVFTDSARDPKIYGNERYGHFTYAIPVAEDGAYDVSLYFAENYWGPENPGGGGVGSRIFDVFCNGESLVRNLDVYKEVGSNHALVERFRGLRSDAQGKLLLSFVPERNYASIYAIEVVDSSR